MINSAVVRCGVTLRVPKGNFLKKKPLLGTFPHLQQNKAHAAVDFVPHQPQDLGNQIKFRSQGAQLTQPLGLVNQKEVSTEAQSFRCGGEHISQRTGLLLPGLGVSGAGKAAGKIGGIGNTAGKTAGDDFRGQLPQVGTYTAKTAVDAVAGGVVKGHGVGLRVQLDAHNGAGLIFGAEQQSQGAAAGA